MTNLSQYQGVTVNYTGRYSVKCGSTVHAEGCRRRTVWDPSQGPRPSLGCTGFVKVQEILGQYNERKACDSRCMGAQGPACDCSCAGVNHGRNVA